MLVRFSCLAALTLLCAQSALAFCPGDTDETWPGYSADYYSVEKEFARAKFVVRVRSLSETWLGEDGKPTWPTPPYGRGASHPMGLDPYLGAIYELEVLEVFKGSPDKKLRLFSSNTTARTPIPPPGEYLLFIQQSRGSDEVGLQIYVDNCGNSSGMPTAGATLQTVRAMAQRKGR
jgi:hypothetical protein